jgi:hypothetical protein
MKNHGTSLSQRRAVVFSTFSQSSGGRFSLVTNNLLQQSLDYDWSAILFSVVRWGILIGEEQFDPQSLAYYWCALLFSKLDWIHTYKFVYTETESVLCKYYKFLYQNVFSSMCIRTSNSYIKFKKGLFNNTIIRQFCGNPEDHPFNILHEYP